MKSISNYINEKLILQKNNINNKEKILINDLHTLALEIVKRIKNLNNNNYIDLTDINVSELTNLSGLGRMINMFRRKNGISHEDYNNIQTINVSGWDVSGVEKFNSCFESLPAKEIIGLDTWDVSNGWDFSDMFLYANVNNLDDIQYWNFRNDKNIIMTNMFSGCIYLDKLDLSNWHVSVYNIENMFNYSNIKEVDISNLITDKLKFMSGLFARCHELETINGLDEFDISNVRDISRLFLNCTKLQYVGNLSKWNVEYIYNMESAFENCNNLKLNLSNWKLNICGNYKKSFYKVNTKIFKKPNKPY
jgi:hypothetical protein